MQKFTISTISALIRVANFETEWVASADWYWFGIGANILQPLTNSNQNLEMLCPRTNSTQPKHQISSY